jgi:hypothetical protein
VFLFPLALQPHFGPWLTSMKLSVSLGLLNLIHSVGLLGRVISSLQGLYLYTNTGKRTHTHTHIQKLSIHVLSGIRTHDPGFRASEDSTCHRPLGYLDRPVCFQAAENHEVIQEKRCYGRYLKRAIPPQKSRALHSD